MPISETITSQNIVKRDGSVAAFDIERIRSAIARVVLQETRAMGTRPEFTVATPIALPELVAQFPDAVTLRAA